jgi:hypothetical protein
MQDSVLKVGDYGAKLTLSQLAEALYEGTPHLQNLAEKLARQHGKAGALSFFGLMGDDVQNHPHLYIWKDRTLSIPSLCFLPSLHTLLSLPRTGSRRRR